MPAGTPSSSDRGAAGGGPSTWTAEQRRLAADVGSDLHCDPQPSQVVAACYLEPVPPGGAGFCIYPGSHRRFYERPEDGFADWAGASFNYPDPARAAAQGSAAAEARFVGNPRFKPGAVTSRYKEIRDNVAATIAPLQIAGAVGDVVLTHGRLFHTASPNYSERLRLAMFYDVVRLDVDARFNAQPDDRAPPVQGLPMWQGWAPAVQSAAAAAVADQTCVAVPRL
eukprot:SAG22_NODE_1569_length_4097_cov_2.299400_3_plen_225_part_00